MPQIVHAIDIDAPVNDVWSVLTDTASWRDWNPLFAGVDGPLRENGVVKAAFKAEGRTFNIKVKVTQCDGEKLVWIGPPQKFLHTLARGEHFFELVDIGEGRTRLFHGERFTGLAFEIPWSKIEPVVDPAYKAFNEALKAEVERKSN